MQMSLGTIDKTFGREYKIQDTEGWGNVNDLPSLSYLHLKTISNDGCSLENKNTFYNLCAFILKQ